MPELPEVETVRRALAPHMQGSRFIKVIQNRKNLRFDFPKNFKGRLEGQTVQSLDRRGKYMIAGLSSGESLIMHLGMSGRFSVIEEPGKAEGKKPKKSGLAAAVSKSADPEEVKVHYGGGAKAAHDHAIFTMGPAGLPHKTQHNPTTKQDAVKIVYNDTRRFGFMDLVDSATLDECRHFAGMGPEPLGNEFNGDVLYEQLKGRKTPIKQALLDQRVVAGLGNIYVCEALFRTGISPKRLAGQVSRPRIEALTTQIRQVLQDAIEAGGSSLRDFASTDGSSGYFQHDFQIYGRQNEPCRQCEGTIVKIVQGGRSTFYCRRCQR